MYIVIGFISFLIYTSLIFFIKEYYLLCVVFIINIILMLIYKINVKKTYLFIIRILPVIIFTGFINILLGGLELGVFIAIRLILICNITYVFSQKMTPKKLQFAIEKTLMPLKILKINTREIGIIVSISLAFIPIIQKEIQNLKYSLQSKGFNINFKNVMKHPNYIFIPLVTSIIKRTVEIEQSMISKGYIG